MKIKCLICHDRPVIELPAPDTDIHQKVYCPCCNRLIAWVIEHRGEHFWHVDLYEEGKTVARLVK